MLCSSYSGNTEETLSAYDDALERGAPRVVATIGGALAERARRDRVPVIPLPGGFQPRAAIGYGLVSALEVAALAGVAPSIRGEIEAAAALAETLAAEWGPDAPEDSQAKALAHRLHGTVPVIAGAELTAPVAYRWKCQVNENAEPARVLVHAPRARPQRGRRLAQLARHRPVLRGVPRGLRRRSAQRGALRAHRRDRGEGADVVERVTSRGETRLERLVSLVLLGDFVSFYLAVLSGVDPVDVEPIDRVKAALAEGSDLAFEHRPRRRSARMQGLTPIR